MQATNLDHRVETYRRTIRVIALTYLLAVTFGFILRQFVPSLSVLTFTTATILLCLSLPFALLQRKNLRRDFEAMVGPSGRHVPLLRSRAYESWKKKRSE